MPQANLDTYSEEPTEPILHLATEREEQTTEILPLRAGFTASLRKTSSPVETSPIGKIIHLDAYAKKRKLEQIHLECPIVKNLKIPDKLQIKLYDQILLPLIMLCREPEEPTARSLALEIRAWHKHTVNHPCLQSFLHDLNNTLCVLLMGLEEVDDPEFNVDDSIRSIISFLSQNPKTTMDVFKLLNVLTPVKILIKNAEDFNPNIHPDQLLQLLLNAAHNTLQAGGNTIIINYSANGFEIIDNGPGFETTDIQTASSQSKSTAAHKGNGLKIIQGIATQNGAQLTLRNRVDAQGAILSIQY